MSIRKFDDDGNNEVLIEEQTAGEGENGAMSLRFKCKVFLRVA
jgi:hypothetical protein